MPNPIYALILAGGSGERFWPLSRRARPKQLLRLVSDKTLLEETLGRLEGLVAPDNTLILTNTEQESAVRKLLDGFPKENIIAEPAKRDTAAAVALGTGWVVARDHAATMVVLPADHVIAKLRAPKNFENALRDRFGKLPRISFDYAIMEKADRVLVVEASFDWDDIGSWRALANYFEKDQQGNAANCAITAIDSSNNIVFEEDGTTIALLGVHDLIVVRTKDALLVCHRHEAEKIKNLIGKLPPELQ